MRKGGGGAGGGGQRGMLVVEVDGGEVVEFDTCPGMDRWIGKPSS